MPAYGSPGKVVGHWHYPTEGRCSCVPSRGRRFNFETKHTFLLEAFSKQFEINFWMLVRHFVCRFLPPFSGKLFRSLSYKMGSRGDENSQVYQLVDIGANLTSGKYGREVDDVIQRAADAGVFKIMVTGTDIEGSKEALRLSRLYPNHLYSTAGVHPHEAKDWTDSCSESIEELCKNKECVAIGECGLDFNRNFSPQDVQIEVFDKQVQLACRLQKPLFVHERDASDALVSVLTKYQSQLPPTVIHCFTGTKAEMKRYLDLGYYIGLTGFLWKDKAPDGVRAILEERLLPLDRLLVETDAPYMYPNVKASKVPKAVRDSITPKSMEFLNRYCSFNRNEPCSLPVTVEMIAAFMKTVPQVVALSTSQNAQKIFGLM